MNILERIKIYENDMEDDDFPDELFGRMAEFIMSLDPEMLSDDELEEAISILQEIEIAFGENIEEAKLAKNAGATKKSYARKWYRMKKNDIKKGKERLKRSSEGRKRLRIKDRLAKSKRTPTGRKKVRYNVSHKTEKERGKKEE